MIQSIQIFLTFDFVFPPNLMSFSDFFDQTIHEKLFNDMEKCAISSFQITWIKYYHMLSEVVKMSFKLISLGYCVNHVCLFYSQVLSQRPSWNQDLLSVALQVYQCSNSSCKGNEPHKSSKWPLFACFYSLFPFYWPSFFNYSQSTYLRL